MLAPGANALDPTLLQTFLQYRPFVEPSLRGGIITDVWDNGPHALILQTPEAHYVCFIEQDPETGEQILCVQIDPLFEEVARA